MSLRVDDWVEFSRDVEDHLEEYTVPQYGDKGEDQATGYSAKVCVQQAMKYLSRFGRNSREGQQVLDFLKAAHYVQMASDKYKEGFIE